MVLNNETILYTSCSAIMILIIKIIKLTHSALLPAKKLSA